jgi:ComF family protein
MRMFGSRMGNVNQARSSWLTTLSAASSVLAELLFPPRCCLCDFEGQPPDRELCAHCERALPFIDALPNDGGHFAAFRFEYPVDDLIRALKYQGQMANARLLGALLGEAVKARAAPLPRLLIPVPLHPTRLRERGFNQAAALAKFAARHLGIRHANRLVRRIRDTPSQTALDVIARRQNVRDAFAVNGVHSLAELVRARHVALVDDVITTGSTSGELRRVLLEAGVRRVDLWAVARAMPKAP